MLRMLSMFMVVVLHVLGQGGMLNNVEVFSVQYCLLWALEIACYCAVDCFALISGYVMYRSKAKLSKAFGLWLQVAFYTIGAVVAVAILKPEWIGLRAIANAVFPVSSGHYWYISAYFGLLVFQPLLNVVLQYTEKKTLGTILITIYILFCTIPNFLMSDPYMLRNGYSTIWLVILYLTGGYIQKYDVAEKIKKSTVWWIIGIAFLLTFGFKMAVERFPQNILAVAKFQSALVSYNSPTMVLIALGLLIALSKQRFGKFGTKVISWGAPAALGVYLIHTNQLVWQYLMKNLFVSLVNYHWAVMLLLVLAAAVTIYFVCTLVEKIRAWLFQLARINILCEKLENKIQKLLNKVISV